MGLAAPRKRRKIGDDPNNTTWANSTTGVGHKIMAAQGWTPGSYLGAENAAHASHYSAANASHIRVLLKDDNLGLGAKRGAAEAQNFGLGGFQDLLGRLNGKAEAVIIKEKEIRADLGRKLYAEQKWGPSRFVRGGYLVGDKIEDDRPAVSEDASALRKIPLAAPEQTRSLINPEALDEAEALNTNRHDNDANDRKEEKTGETKAERRQRKLEKRSRKEAANRLKSMSANRSTPQDSTETEVTSTGTSDVELATWKAMTQDKTNPAGVAINQPGSRMAVRQRYIKQKRMASMDPQALREILMIKS